MIPNSPFPGFDHTHLENGITISTCNEMHEVGCQSYAQQSEDC